VYCLANFRDGKPAEYGYSGRAPQGAPVFSVPTGIGPHGGASATFRFREGPDLWSEEPHFYVTSLTGVKVLAVGRYHRLELTALGGPATVTVRFFSATRKGPVRVDGAADLPGTIDAADFRGKGLTVKLKADVPVRLVVSDPVDRDRLGPFVDITAPRWKRDTRREIRLVQGPPQRVHHGHPGLWEPIKGTYTFRADAFDRSGVAKVEFYLNNGQLIGTVAEAPYECQYEVRDTFCQYAYAVAYDSLGNKRRSFVVPFGDGSVGPSMMTESQEDYSSQRSLGRLCSRVPTQVLW
jgi:hypothetical protein